METKKHTVLIVDDAPALIEPLATVLRDEYQVKTATSGKKALEVIERELPDLILLDIMMPEMDGYEVCRRLKAMPRAHDLPIIFLTALGEVQDESEGFEAGAVDYIIKPAKPAIVRARVKTHIELKQHREHLEAMVRTRTREVVHTQAVTILGMATLAEYRDKETGEHIRRTQHFVRLIAEKLQVIPQYHHLLDSQTIDMLFRSAPLHDIGKVAIEDSILKNETAAAGFV